MLSQYFDHNIKPALLTELAAAQQSICCAVAWVRDREIVSALIERAGAGVLVEIVLNADQINQKTILQLGSTNVRMYLYEAGSFNSKLHHKFAVVDNKTLLFGSFNWTWAATNRNEEDMSVVREEPEAVTNFLKKFEQLKKVSHLYAAPEKKNKSLSSTFMPPRPKKFSRRDAAVIAAPIATIGTLVLFPFMAPVLLWGGAIGYGIYKRVNKTRRKL